MDLQWLLQEATFFSKSIARAALSVLRKDPSPLAISDQRLSHSCLFSVARMMWSNKLLPALRISSMASFLSDIQEYLQFLLRQLIMKLRLRSCIHRYITPSSRRSHLKTWYVPYPPELVSTQDVFFNVLGCVEVGLDKLNKSSFSRWNVFSQLVSMSWTIHWTSASSLNLRQTQVRTIQEFFVICHIPHLPQSVSYDILMLRLISLPLKLSGWIFLCLQFFVFLSFLFPRLPVLGMRPNEPFSNFERKPAIHEFLGVQDADETSLLGRSETEHTVIYLVIGKTSWNHLPDGCEMWDPITFLWKTVRSQAWSLLCSCKTSWRLKARSTSEEFKASLERLERYLVLCRTFQELARAISG